MINIGLDIVNRRSAHGLHIDTLARWWCQSIPMQWWASFSVLVYQIMFAYFSLQLLNFHMM